MDSVRIQRSICRFDFTSACSNTFSFFVADHFLKADHHMAHGYMAAPSAVVEWFPQFKCATISKSTIIFDTLYHILILCILWLYEESAVFCFVLFLLLLSFFLYCFFRGFRYWCLFFFNFKGIGVWFCVHCLRCMESHTHFLPSSLLLDQGKKLQLWVEFFFVTAALKSRWSRSTGVQITQQQVFKNKTAGDFCAI